MKNFDDENGINEIRRLYASSDNTITKLLLLGDVCTMLGNDGVKVLRDLSKVLITIS